MIIPFVLLFWLAPSTYTGRPIRDNTFLNVRNLFYVIYSAVMLAALRAPHHGFFLAPVTDEGATSPCGSVALRNDIAQLLLSPHHPDNV